MKEDPQKSHSTRKIAYLVEHHAASAFFSGEFGSFNSELSKHQRLLGFVAPVKFGVIKKRAIEKNSTKRKLKTKKNSNKIEINCFI